MENKIDDRHEYFSYASLCATCVHFDALKCRAFPNGIPIKYLSGEKKHLQVDKNQVGNTTYEKKKY